MIVAEVVGDLPELFVFLEDGGHGLAGFHWIRLGDEAVQPLGGRLGVGAVRLTGLEEGQGSAGLGHLTVQGQGLDQAEAGQPLEQLQLLLGSDAEEAARLQVRVL